MIKLVFIVTVFPQGLGKHCFCVRMSEKVLCGFSL